MLLIIKPLLLLARGGNTVDINVSLTLERSTKIQIISGSMQFKINLKIEVGNQSGTGTRFSKIE